MLRDNALGAGGFRQYHLAVREHLSRPQPETGGGVFGRSPVFPNNTIAALWVVVCRCLDGPLLDPIPQAGEQHTVLASDGD